MTKKTARRYTSIKELSNDCDRIKKDRETFQKKIDALKEQRDTKFPPPSSWLAKYKKMLDMIFSLKKGESIMVVSDKYDLIYRAVFDGPAAKPELARDIYNALCKHDFHYVPMEVTVKYCSKNSLSLNALRDGEFEMTLSEIHFEYDSYHEDGDAEEMNEQQSLPFYLKKDYEEHMQDTQYCDGHEEGDVKYMEEDLMDSTNCDGESSGDHEGLHAYGSTIYEGGDMLILVKGPPSSK